jgi:hypothetical protein
MRRLAKRQYDPAAILELYSVPIGTHAAFLDGLPQARKDHLRLLAGHLAFGLHRHLPRPAAYFAVLRDPVERVISDYHYIRSNEDHELHRLVAGRCPTLEHFVSCPELVSSHNGQVQGVSGIVDCRDGEEALSIAKRNILECFAMVGLTSRFDETLLLLEEALCWRPSYSVAENVNHGRPRGVETSDDLRSRIEERDALDVALYRWTETLFEQEVARRGEGFQHELRMRREKSVRISSLIERGRQAAEAGEVDAARGPLEEALSNEPLHPLAHHWLSVALAQREDLREAFEHAAIALELDPFERQILIHCACLLERIGRSERARALYRFYLERHNPYDAEIQRRLEEQRSTDGPEVMALLSACARLRG